MYRAQLAKLTIVANLNVALGSAYCVGIARTAHHSPGAVSRLLLSVPEATVCMYGLPHIHTYMCKKNVIVFLALRTKQTRELRPLRRRRKYRWGNRSPTLHKRICVRHPVRCCSLDTFVPDYSLRGTYFVLWVSGQKFTGLSSLRPKQTSKSSHIVGLRPGRLITTTLVSIDRENSQLTIILYEHITRYFVHQRCQQTVILRL